MHKSRKVGAIISLLSFALIAPPVHAQQRGGADGGWSGAGSGSARGWASPGYGGVGYYRGPYSGYGYGRGYGGFGIGLGGDIGLPGYGGFGYGYDGRGIGIDSYIPYRAAVYGNYAPLPNMLRPLIVGLPANQQAGAPIANGNAPGVAVPSNGSGPSSFPSTADLTVKVPPHAQLWLGTMLSEQQGPERTFSFPSLQGNNGFSLRCTWSENGELVSHEKNVELKPGQNATVDFTQQPEARAQPSTAPQPGKPRTPPPLPPTGLPK